MPTVITKNHSKEEIKKLLGKKKPLKRGSDVGKYLGKLKWKGNALKVQKDLRNEE
jgi:hypothetical protein